MIAASFLAGACLLAIIAQERQPLDRTGALRVFLDCNACDENYLRTEITYINYVRDRTDADLHVLVTTQATGGAGTEYTLQFIGLGRFAGVEQSLKYVAAQTNTPDETRRGFASIFALGLVRYVAETPLASRMKVAFESPKQAGAAGSCETPGTSGFSGPRQRQLQRRGVAVGAELRAGGVGKPHDRG